MTELTPNVMHLHSRMLNDRGRTQSFITAIEQVVRPGDVVVDVGTGTGILAIAAARAGAERVYAIEAGPVGGVAARMFAANDPAGRITLIEGHSSGIDLPELADILVTEIFGNGALLEEVLQTTLDARRRFLRRDARLLPRGVRVFAIPVSIPEGIRVQRFFTPDNLKRWEAWYGIDFSPLRDVNRNALLVYNFRPADMELLRPLCKPLLLAEVELSAYEGKMVENTCLASALTEGALGGLITYFELWFDSHHFLSTSPYGARTDNHWLNPVYMLVDPLTLRSGDLLELRYRYFLEQNHEEIHVQLKR